MHFLVRSAAGSALYCFAQCRWCERTYQNKSNCNAHERKTHPKGYNAERSRENPPQRIQEKLKDIPEQKLAASLHDQKMAALHELHANMQ